MRNRYEQRRRNAGPNNSNNKGKKGKGNKGNSLTDPYTPREARNVARSEAQTEYGPTIRAAKQQREGSRQREKEVGGWFNALENKIGQSAAETDQSYAAANNALVAHANAAAEAARGSQAQIIRANQDTMNLTGADPSLFNKANAEGAAAANQRQIAMAALSAPIAQAGASQAGYLRSTGVNTAREAISQKQAEQRRRDAIVEDINALRGERAKKSVANFNAIKDKEFEKQVQRKAFNLEGKQFKQGQLENEQDRSENHERLEFEKEREKGNGGAGELTPSERREIKEDRQNALAVIRNSAAQGKLPKSNSEWAEYTSLLTEQGIPPAVAEWAVKVYRKRHPANAVGGIGKALGL